ncbi:MAG: glycosyltransferase family 39 protein, partial [Patescibacteria group bacterium]
MKTKIILILIILLAIVLRFWDLGKNPPGINLDEAAIGYNAYSILKTGRDEYGQLLPLQFRSLDDYKPPLYIYLTVPSVAVFGLNEFSVRLPSAILGVLAVVLTFFLAREMFNERVAVITALLLAISPWHLQFTRTAYETGSLAFFTTGGLLLFLWGLKKRPWLILSAVFFGLELYLYQAA